MILLFCRKDNLTTFLTKFHLLLPNSQLLWTKRIYARMIRSVKHIPLMNKVIFKTMMSNFLEIKATMK
jgi:hypothetical protein